MAWHFGHVSLGFVIRCPGIGHGAAAHWIVIFARSAGCVSLMALLKGLLGIGLNLPLHVRDLFG